MTATRFLVTDLARELRWQYRRQSVKAFTDIIAELEKREGTKDVVEYSTEYLFALHVAKVHPDDHRALEQVQARSYALSDAIKRWKYANE